MRPGPRLPVRPAPVRAPAHPRSLLRAAALGALASAATLAPAGCGPGNPDAAASPGTPAAAAASDAVLPPGVLPPGTYQARAHAQAVDYRDQTAVVEGQLRVTDSTHGRDGYRAYFRAAGAKYDAYFGTVLTADDTVRVGLACESCRVQAAFGPVSRTTMWSGLYRARALGGGRFELRQLRDGDNQPAPRPTVDTLVRVGG